MEIRKKELVVEKTARYYTLGNLNEKTKYIWFVLHGYAQTAEAFLESLEPLLREDTFIIAPEALSRFYWKDFINEPVASWMTKSDRLVDIKDNLKYLNDLYYSILSDFRLKDVCVNYIGFSQGAATLSRWLFHGALKIDNIFFYAGSLATELDYAKSDNYKAANLYYIYGDKDFLVHENEVETMKKEFQKAGLSIEDFKFSGKHKIVKDALDFIDKHKNKQ